VLSLARYRPLCSRGGCARRSGGERGLRPRQTHPAGVAREIATRLFPSAAAAAAPAAGQTATERAVQSSSTTLSPVLSTLCAAHCEIYVMHFSCCGAQFISRCPIAHRICLGFVRNCKGWILVFGLFAT